MTQTHTEQKAGAAVSVKFAAACKIKFKKGYLITASRLYYSFFANGWFHI
jgi:hypothetical protein